MRVLLDESVPRQLADRLGNHVVTTVPKVGWAGFRNGELMSKAAAEFDVFITADAILSSLVDLQPGQLARVAG